MAKVIFTPWKTQSQLLDVRSQFYPPSSYAGPDLRSHACARVEAWKLRGNVPHHVEATALLTDAILHDDAMRNSIFSIRATYSAAFCRFVTGLVDTKIPGQRRTMFQRAVDLGLPASFVELRHEATHREPPSLVVLRKATSRSLEWLWDHYWAHIDDLGDFSVFDHDDPMSTRSALRSALQHISGDSGTEPLPKKRKRDLEDGVASQIVAICKCSERALLILPATLLDESSFVNPARKLGESLKETFDKWDPTLLKIADSQPSFLRYLTEKLAFRLVFDQKTASPQSALGEGIFLWLIHLLTSPTWDSQQALCPRSYLLSICDGQSTHWGKMFSAHLREHDSKTRASSASHPAPSCSSTKQASLNDSRESSIAENLREHGWAPVEKWVNRPLGGVSYS